MKAARIIFYAEVLLSFYAAVTDLFNPSTFVSDYTREKVTGIPLEMIRWYGVQLLPLVYLEFSALWSRRDDLLAWVLGAFLIGDILQIVTTVDYMLNHPSTNWTGGFLFSLLVVVLLATVRIVWLTRYHSFEKIALTETGDRT